MPLSPRNRKKPRLREYRNGSAQFSFCLIADSKMLDGLIAVRHFFIRADGRVLRLHSAFRILQSAFGVGGIAQLVERQLCKLDVRGSNPLASNPPRQASGSARAEHIADPVEPKSLITSVP